MPDVPGLEPQLAKMREAAAQSFPPLVELNRRMVEDLESSVIANALDIGDEAPDFELADAGTDAKVRLSSVLEEGPVVLSFYRGHWWPYCNMELQVLQQAYPKIQALGARVFFIGPETRDNALKFMDKQKATIPLLYDLDGSVMEAYKVAFTIPEYLQRGYQMLYGFPDANPETGWRLPVPATFIVDQHGVIRGRYLNADYTYRMEPAEMLAVLEEIVSQG